MKKLNNNLGNQDTVRDIMAGCSCNIGCRCRTVNNQSNQGYQREYWYEQAKSTAYTGNVPY